MWTDLIYSCFRPEPFGTGPMWTQPYTPHHVFCARATGRNSWFAHYVNPIVDWYWTSSVWTDTQTWSTPVSNQDHLGQVPCEHSLITWVERGDLNNFSVKLTQPVKGMDFDFNYGARILRTLIQIFPSCTVVITILSCIWRQLFCFTSQVCLQLGNTDKVTTKKFQWLHQAGHMEQS